MEKGANEGLSMEENVADDIASVPELVLPTAAKDDKNEELRTQEELGKDTVEAESTAESAKAAKRKKKKKKKKKKKTACIEDVESPTTNNERTKEASESGEIPASIESIDHDATVAGQDRDMNSPVLHKELSKEDSVTDDMPATPDSYEATAVGDDSEVKPSFEENSMDMGMADEVTSTIDQAEGNPVENKDLEFPPPHEELSAVDDHGNVELQRSHEELAKERMTHDPASKPVSAEDNTGEDDKDIEPATADDKHSQGEGYVVDEIASTTDSAQAGAFVHDSNVETLTPLEKPSNEDSVSTSESFDVSDIANKHVLSSTGEEEFPKEDDGDGEIHSSQGSAEVATIAKDQALSSTTAPETSTLEDNQGPSVLATAVDAEKDIDPGIADKTPTKDERQAGDSPSSPDSGVATATEDEGNVKSIGPHGVFAKEDKLADEVSEPVSADATPVENIEDADPVTVDEELSKEEKVAGEITSTTRSVEATSAIEDVESLAHPEEFSQENTVGEELASGPVSVDALHVEDDIHAEPVGGDKELTKESVAEKVISPDSTGTAAVDEDKNVQAPIPHEEPVKEDKVTGKEVAEAVPVGDEKDARSVARDEKSIQEESVGDEMHPTMDSAEASPVFDDKFVELPAPHQQLGQEDTVTDRIDPGPESAVATPDDDGKAVEPVTMDEELKEEIAEPATGNEVHTKEESITEQTTPTTGSSPPLEDEDLEFSAPKEQVAKEHTQTCVAPESSVPHTIANDKDVEPALVEDRDMEHEASKEDLFVDETGADEPASIVEPVEANATFEAEGVKPPHAEEVPSKEDTAVLDPATPTEDEDVESASPEAKEEILIASDIAPAAESSEVITGLGDEDVQPSGVKSEVSEADKEPQELLHQETGSLEVEEPERAAPVGVVTKEGSDEVPCDPANEPSPNVSDDGIVCRDSPVESPESTEYPEPGPGHEVLSKEESAANETDLAAMPSEGARLGYAGPETTEHEEDVIRTPGPLKESVLDTFDDELLSKEENMMNERDLAATEVTASIGDTEPEVIENEEDAAGTRGPREEPVPDVPGNDELSKEESVANETDLAAESAEAAATMGDAGTEATKNGEDAIWTQGQPGVKAGEAGTDTKVSSPDDKISEESVAYKTTSTEACAEMKDREATGPKEEPSKEAAAIKEGEDVKPAQAKEECAKDDSRVNHATSVEPIEVTTTLEDKLQNGHVQHDVDAVEANEPQEPPPLNEGETLPSEGDTGPAAEFKLENPEHAVADTADADISPSARQYERLDVKADGLDSEAPEARVADTGVAVKGLDDVPAKADSFGQGKNAQVEEAVPSLKTASELEAVSGEGLNSSAETVEDRAEKADLDKSESAASGTPGIDLSISAVTEHDQEGIPQKQVSRDGAVPDSVPSSVAKVEDKVGTDDNPQGATDEEVKEITGSILSEIQPSFAGKDDLLEEDNDGKTRELVPETEASMDGRNEETPEKVIITTDATEIAGTLGGLEDKDSGAEKLSPQVLSSVTQAPEGMQSSDNAEQLLTSNGENLIAEQGSFESGRSSSNNGSSFLFLKEASGPEEIAEKHVVTVDSPREQVKYSPIKDLNSKNSGSSLEKQIVQETPETTDDLEEDETPVPLSTHTSDLSSSLVSISPIRSAEGQFMSDDSNSNVSQRSQLARPGDELTRGGDDWRIVSQHEISPFDASNPVTKSEKHDGDRESSGTKFPFSIVLWCSQSMSSLFGVSKQ